MKEKNIPQRMCIVCRQMFDKKDLIRIVRNEDGTVSVDLSGKANGRGAYMCKSPECFARCRKQKALNRTFKTEVPEAEYDRIAEEINAGNKR